MTREATVISTSETTAKIVLSTLPQAIVLVTYTMIAFRRAGDVLH